MDYIASTISFDQIDELFHFSTLPYQEHRVDELDGINFAPLQPSQNVLAAADLHSGPPSVKPQAAPRCTASAEQNPSKSSEKRKIMRRDIERQRRQEMACLYRSLRSHLPLELLKGRRSASDHIHQAVGYIKNLQSKVQQLSDKRDELKRVSDSNKTDDPKTNKQAHPRPGYQDIVMIEPCSRGIKIMISTDSRRRVALSKVLGFLTQEGMNVISCISAKVNESLLHSVKSEVICDDGNQMDNLNELKEKLMNLLH